MKPTHYILSLEWLDRDEWKPLGLPATRPVLTYPVTLDGEVILVDVDSPATPTS